MKSIKAEAKSSRATKLHALGGKGMSGKSLDLAPGHTWNGEAGMTSDDKVNQAQRIPTRKSGGRVDGDKARSRLDRKGAKKRADGGSTGSGTGVGSDPDERDAVKAYDARRNSEGSTGTYARDFEGGESPSDKQQRSKTPTQMTSTPRSQRASGGRVGKGKTNITIVVAPGGGQQQPAAPPQRVPVPVPVPPPPAPPMGGGAPGMGMPPGGPPMGGAMPPPMMRKKGGRVMMHAGAGGGEGRLEKIAIQKRAGK